MRCNHLEMALGPFLKLLSLSFQPNLFKIPVWMLGWETCQPRFCSASWFPVRPCQSGVSEGERTGRTRDKLVPIPVAPPGQHCFPPAVAVCANQHQQLIPACGFPALAEKVSSHLLRLTRTNDLAAPQPRRPGSQPQWVHSPHLFPQ